ncbi:MAG: DUF1801 domain-containing protein [Sediminibacterium sp.]
MAKETRLSGPEQVTEFMLSVKHPLKSAIEILRKLVLSINKGITEHIKWNSPSFCFKDDDRITFNLHKSDCVMIVYHCGARGKEVRGKEPIFKDATGLLEWLSNERAVIKLYGLEEIQEKKGKLIKVVKQWIKETTD